MEERRYWENLLNKYERRIALLKQQEQNLLLQFADEKQYLKNDNDQSSEFEDYVASRLLDEESIASDFSNEMIRHSNTRNKIKSTFANEKNLVSLLPNNVRKKNMRDSGDAALLGFKSSNNLKKDLFNLKCMLGEENKRFQCQLNERNGKYCSCKPKINNSNSATLYNNEDQTKKYAEKIIKLKNQLKSTFEKMHCIENENNDIRNEMCTLKERCKQIKKSFTEQKLNEAHAVFQLKDKFLEHKKAKGKCIDDCTFCTIAKRISKTILDMANYSDVDLSEIEQRVKQKLDEEEKPFCKCSKCSCKEDLLKDATVSARMLEKEQESLYDKEEKLIRGSKGSFELQEDVLTDIENEAVEVIRGIEIIPDESGPQAEDDLFLEHTRIELEEQLQSDAIIELVEDFGDVEEIVKDELDKMLLTSDGLGGELYVTEEAEKEIPGWETLDVQPSQGELSAGIDIYSDRVDEDFGLGNEPDGFEEDRDYRTDEFYEDMIGADMLEEGLSALDGEPGYAEREPGYIEGMPYDSSKLSESGPYYGADDTEFVDERSKYGDGALEEDKPGYGGPLDEKESYIGSVAAGYSEEESSIAKSLPGYSEGGPSISETVSGYSEKPDYLDGAPGYSEGAPGYLEGAPGYTEGRPGYLDGESGYAEGRPGYSEGVPGYSEGKPEYLDGAQGHTEGAPGYTEGRPGYSEGVPGYSEGKPEYLDGAQGHTEGAPGYTEGRPGYSEEVPEYLEGKPGVFEGTQGYIEGAPGYPEGRPEYSERAPGYLEDQPDHFESGPDYTKDESGYTKDDPRYLTEGRPGYSEDGSTYSEGQPGYSEGGILYSESEPGYSEDGPSITEGEIGKGYAGKDYGDIPEDVPRFSEGEQAIYEDGFTDGILGKETDREDEEFKTDDKVGKTADETKHHPDCECVDCLCAGVIRDREREQMLEDGKLRRGSVGDEDDFNKPRDRMGVTEKESEELLQETRYQTGEQEAPIDFDDFEDEGLRSNKETEGRGGQPSDLREFGKSTRPDYYEKGIYSEADMPQTEFCICDTPIATEKRRSPKKEKSRKDKKYRKGTQGIDSCVCVGTEKKSGSSESSKSSSEESVSAEEIAIPDRPSCVCRAAAESICPKSDASNQAYMDSTSYEEGERGYDQYEGISGPKDSYDTSGRRMPYGGQQAARGFDQARGPLPSDEYNITTAIADSGTIEVITQGPEGAIETLMTYTPSGNIEVKTEITEYECPTKEICLAKAKESELYADVAEPYYFGAPTSAEDLTRDVADALNKANQEVMDALNRANQSVSDAMEKANKDVESALAMVMAKRTNSVSSPSRGIDSEDHIIPEEDEYKDINIPGRELAQSYSGSQYAEDAKDRGKDTESFPEGEDEERDSRGWDEEGKGTAPFGDRNGEKGKELEGEGYTPYKERDKDWDADEEMKGRGKGEDGEFLPEKGWGRDEDDGISPDRQRQKGTGEDDELISGAERERARDDDGASTPGEEGGRTARDEDGEPVTGREKGWGKGEDGESIPGEERRRGKGEDDDLIPDRERERGRGEDDEIGPDGQRRQGTEEDGEMFPDTGRGRDEYGELIPDREGGQGRGEDGELYPDKERAWGGDEGASGWEETGREGGQDDDIALRVGDFDKDVDIADGEKGIDEEGGEGLSALVDGSGECTCDECFNKEEKTLAAGDCTCTAGCTCPICTDLKIIEKASRMSRLHPPDCTCIDCLCKENMPKGTSVEKKELLHPPGCDCITCICGPGEVNDCGRACHPADCTCLQCICSPRGIQGQQLEALGAEHPEDCDCIDCICMRGLPADKEQLKGAGDKENVMTEKATEPCDHKPGCGCLECICDEYESRMFKRIHKSVGRNEDCTLHSTSCECLECLCKMDNIMLSGCSSRAHSINCDCLQCLCEGEKELNTEEPSDNETITDIRIRSQCPNDDHPPNCTCAENYLNRNADKGAKLSECPCSNEQIEPTIINISNASAEGMEITDVRRISPDSLLVKWTECPFKETTGYEVFVNGVSKSRVYSKFRTATVLHSLKFDTDLDIQVYGIFLGGFLQPPAKAVFEVLKCKK